MRSKFYALPREVAREARQSLAQLDRGEAMDLSSEDMDHWREMGHLPERVMRWVRSTTGTDARRVTGMSIRGKVST